MQSHYAIVAPYCCRFLIANTPSRPSDIGCHRGTGHTYYYKRIARREGRAVIIHASLAFAVFLSRARERTCVCESRLVACRYISFPSDYPVIPRWITTYGAFSRVYVITCDAAKGTARPMSIFKAENALALFRRWSIDRAVDAHFFRSIRRLAETRVFYVFAFRWLRDYYFWLGNAGWLVVNER